MKSDISQKMKDNFNIFNERMHVNENFDIISRVITIGNRACCLYVIDGLNKDEILEKILEFFYRIPET